MTERRFIAHGVMAAALALIVASAGAADLVREFRGSRDTTTTEFDVTAPWILDWRVGSSFPTSSRFELWIVDPVTGFNESRVLQLKRTGSGTKLFREGGRLRLRINASYADWYLKISELSETEANEFVEAPKAWERR